MTTGQETASATLQPDTVPAVLRWSATLGKLAESIGKAGTLFLLPLVLITVWDVTQRKVLKFVGDFMYYQGWLEARDWMYTHLLEWLPFRSTLLQELEWHFHTALVAMVLGYGYIYNRHVRVDLVREKLSFRRQAWIEFLGCSIFMIPFCIVVAYFAVDYAMQSYELNEQSASLVGLSHRWAIKSVLVAGLMMAGLAGLAVWLQVAFSLFARSPSDAPLYTIERADEKLQKRQILEEADPIADRETGEQKVDSSKLMSRQIGAEAFRHATETKGQLFFYYFGIVIMVVVLALVFHTFNFWSWLI
jgi:TRAP-type mannitol/chloroaromatic compound transport system permease small subunit